MSARPDRRSKAFRARIESPAAQETVIKVSPSLAADIFGFAGSADVQHMTQETMNDKLEDYYTVQQLRHSNAILRRLTSEAKANLQQQLRLNKVLDAQLRQKDAYIEQLTSRIYALSDRLCQSATASTRALASYSLPEARRKRNPAGYHGTIVQSQLYLSYALDEASDRARFYQNAALKGQLAIQDLEDKLLRSKMEVSLFSLQARRSAGSGAFGENQASCQSPPDFKYPESKSDS